MRQAKTFIFLLIILTVLSSSVMAAERGKAPRFDGDSFSGVVGPGVDTQAILNVTPETVALYLYFPKEDLLRQLWSVPAKSVRTEDGWQVVLPEKNLAFHLGIAANGEVSLDGQTKRLRAMEPRDIDRLPAEAQRADCQGGGLAAQTPPREIRGPQLGDAKSEQLCNCCLALIFNGCCSSCYCVHRSLDLPYIFDELCCGFGC
jgi:hypothetical protein